MENAQAIKGIATAIIDSYEQTIDRLKEQHEQAYNRVMEEKKRIEERRMLYDEMIDDIYDIVQAGINILTGELPESEIVKIKTDYEDMQELVEDFAEAITRVLDEKQIAKVDKCSGCKFSEYGPDGCYCRRDTAHYVNLLHINYAGCEHYTEKEN